MMERPTARFVLLAHSTLSLSLMGATFAVSGSIRRASAAPPAFAGPAKTSGVPIIHVPGDVSSLQDAINQIPDGGVIILAAGTYPAPAGGFVISDLQKGFTIRAASGASVVLDGEGARDILRFINTDLSQGGPVVFDGLVFANGYSATNGVAGGVTLLRAQATFVNCTFRANRGASSGGSPGGALVTLGSTVFFLDTDWTDNSSSTFGGGLAVQEGSKVYVHRGHFIRNRTNLPGHSATSAGGGIHVGNSVLRVTDTRFENNQAGYVGGAVYAIGTWTDPVTVPQADVLIANSEFTNNHAIRDPSVSFPFPTEGGALHAEDQTLARVYNSRFTLNSAEAGGGVNQYRATVEVRDSVLQGNRAFGSGSANGFGGAISAVSNDAVDSSTGDGTINRPPATLHVENTLIQGRFDTVTVVAQAGGGIYATGDVNRAYGENGVPQMGTPAENRAAVTLVNVVLSDLDVQELPGAGGTGVGGGLLADLVDLRVQGGVIMHSDALGTGNSSGGGMAVIQESYAEIDGTTFAGNTSEKFGGALFIQGSTINLTDCKLIKNAVGSVSFGSALFSSPSESRGLPVDGIVENCVISENTGLPVFDDDREPGPINDVRYNDNAFFHNDNPDAVVYSDSLPNYSWKTVAELNSLVIQRAGGPSTEKSQVPNSALSSRPAAGALLAAPPHVLQIDVPGNPATSAPAYLGFAWAGNSAALDGVSLGSEHAGLRTFSQAGSHTLTVDVQDFNATISAAATPSAQFSASPQGAKLTLDWLVDSGTFLDAAIDQGVAISPAPSGSAEVPSDPGRVYSFYAVTAEGGVVRSVDTTPPLLSAPDSLLVLAGLNRVENYGYLTIHNVGGSTMNWTAQGSPLDLIQLQNGSGATEDIESIVFFLDVAGRAPGDYGGFIDIDAGQAGSQRVDVTVRLVEKLQLAVLPVITR